MKIRYLFINSILGRTLSEIAKRHTVDDEGVLKILMYHDVPYRDFDKFQSQIKFIAGRYGFVKPDDLQNILNGRMKYSGARVLLTFDDGFDSNTQLAEKILDPLGIKAIFFIPVGFISAKDRKEQKAFIAENLCNNRFALEKISDEMTPMSWPDLEHLLDNGHTIGAHTVNHRRLSKIKSESELRHEIIESGDMLQEKLNVNIDHFSFPFGYIDSIDQRAMKIIKERYKYCHSGIRGNNSAGTDMHAILRDAVSVNDSPEYFQFILENGLGPMYRKRASALTSLRNDAA